MIERLILAVGLVLTALSLTAIAAMPDDVETTHRPSNLPDTGQTTKYSHVFGEDADFNGDQPSYVDNSDGTITDRVTGLMWQKTDGGEMTWEAAQEYAKELRLCKYQDWRLPGSMELLSLMNYDKHGPAMDTQFFPRTDARYWWTDSVRVDDHSKIWLVNTGGGIGAHAKREAVSAGGDRPIHVRCVRGAASFGVGPQLIDNGDGTVTDQKTGLIWHLPDAAAMPWEEAIGWCAKLNVSGHNDWRLPNIKELRSINDDRLVNPSLDCKFFPYGKAACYWSSTTQSNRPQRAWYVDFTTGLISYDDKSKENLIVAVRGCIDD